MNGFEGYIGIPLWNEQFFNDLLLSLLLFMLLSFALIFQGYTQQFMKTVKDAFLVRERQSIFDSSPLRDSRIFSFFMRFQFLFLSSLGLFVFGNHFLCKELLSVKSSLETIIGLFLILFVYYQFKQLTYFTVGSIFTEYEKYKFWKINYNAIMSIWGVSMYLPVIWLIIQGKYIIIPFILFLLFYIFSRIVIIYKTIRIFHTHKYGILYLCLYLCGQEILPLLFLYKGIIYLYNIIETATLWH